MITPLNDNILIKIKGVDKINGIIVSQDIINEKAKVIKVGDKVTKVKNGETIYFKSWAIDKVVFYNKKEEELAFIKEEFVLGKE